MSADASDELPDYGNPHRLPFKAVEWLWDDRGAHLNIAPVDMTTDYGMSKTLARCIQRFSVCVDCGHAPFPLEQHSKCKRDARAASEVRIYRDRHGRRQEYHTPYTSLCQVVFATGMDEVIRSEIRADRQRSDKFRRKLGISKSKAARQERIRQKHELLALHEGHCYYCFAPIGQTDDAAHFDHFVPVVQRGTSDLWNLVVACKTCNSDKFTIPGAEFRAAILQRLNKTTRESLAALQARVDAWRMQQLQGGRKSQSPETGAAQVASESGAASPAWIDA